MKVIERSPTGGESSPSDISDRLRGVWQFGLSWDQDIQAQQVLLKRLGKLLDNTYTAITNVAIPEFSLPIPLVLVGPNGVWTFYVTAVKGIFRLKEKNWYRFDDRKKKYALSRPNLIRRSALMSRAIRDYLGEKGYFLNENEPVLFFAHAGIHVEAPEATVRLLYSDGLDRFVSGLLEGELVLDSSEVKGVTEILTKSKPAEVIKRDNLGSILPSQELVGVGEFLMRPWQWIVLFVLAILLLIIVIITAYVMLNN